MATDKPPEMDECKRNELYLSKLDTRLDSWMGDLPPKLCKIPIRYLAIPGTHDSASFYLDKTSDISPGEDKKIREFIENKLAGIPWLGPYLEQIGKNVVYNWAITQGFNFTEQLNNGVRYFDLRVATKNSDTFSPFYFVHGLYGMEMEKGLREIAHWLDGHPKEVVFLDFNHLFMDDSRLLGLNAILLGTFGGKLFPNLNPIAIDATLADVWGILSQVIVRVFYSNPDKEEQKKGKTYVNGNMMWIGEGDIVSPWSNKPDIDEVIEFLNNHKRDKSKFYVSQAVITPNEETILTHPCSTLKGVATDAMPKILTWLEGKKSGSGDHGLNIVIADSVDRKFAEAVIKLNYPVTKPEDDAH
ncbi:PI-PLC X domain-containing protein 2 [Branchiostoma belcheri]|nr:PI-PLC X domain-containing protein 2 [Branchiostoma belcheri]